MRGILGVFRELDAAVDAINALKRQRVGDITVYTPTPRARAVAPGARDQSCPQRSPRTSVAPIWRMRSRTAACRSGGHSTQTP